MKNLPVKPRGHLLGLRIAEVVVHLFSWLWLPHSPAIHFTLDSVHFVRDTSRSGWVRARVTTGSVMPCLRERGANPSRSTEANRES